ncbi:hypothetical protein [Pyxidicoccus xibeiensis]|uniref:hypothetical protein n=1 Tax=Pyxidicoccus xibeiensis TaxID=2906759 RepID=UPI0020A82B72|nr:hypothetical protein [Pyxidicoccus xibeiensis]MCP3138717.1 hypothetical protein [Pyxidicoccus xibeiensis]
MNWKNAVAGCLAVLALAACGSEEEDTLRQGRLALRDGQSLGQAQECGVGLPQCAQDLSCISFTLDGVSQARCVDESTLCGELLTCTGGTECTIAMSYPGQAFCAGRCEGPDCDDSVSSTP